MTDTINVQVQDQVLASASAQFVIPVVNNVAITTASLPTATQGVAYSTPIALTGGIPPYDGLVINTTGLNAWSMSGANLIGTPSTVETANLTFLIGDSVGVPAAALLSLTVIGPLTALWPDPLPSGTINVPYSFTLTASGGVPPYTYALTAGTLPTGLTLDPATGIISGTPTVTASFQAVTFSVTDSSP